MLRPTVFDLGSGYLRIVRGSMTDRITSACLFTQTDFTDDGQMMPGQTIYLPIGALQALTEILTEEMNDVEKEEA